MNAWVGVEIEVCIHLTSIYWRLRWSRGSVLAFSTQVRGFNPAEAGGFLGWKNPQHAFLRRGSKAVSSVPCRRFKACKRSINLCGSRNLGKITGHLSRPQFHLSLLGSLASLRTYRHLAAKVGTSKVGESNGKLPPSTCPGCSVPEPYRSHDWTLVPASPAFCGWILMNEWMNEYWRMWSP